MLKGVRDFFRVLNMPCVEHSPLMSRALDGELPRSMRVALRLHFLVCVPCRRLSAQLSTIHQVLRARPVQVPQDHEHMPPEVRARLEKRLRARG